MSPALGRRFARGASGVVATLAIAALGNSCALDGRAVGVAGKGGDSSVSGSGGSPGGAGGDGVAAGSGGAAGASMGGSFGGDEGLAGAGGDAGGSGGSVPDAGTVVEPPELPFCASQFISGVGSATAATRVDAEGRFSPSCAPGSTDDVGVYWVAPAAGYYSIDTFGSSFDTALAVLSASCTTELACNDDAAAGFTSEVVREFAAGEEVVLVVDGKSGSFGDVVVNTHAVACPVLDLNRQSPPVSTSTLDGTNEHAGACGGDGQPEKAFRWKSRTAGLFRFTATAEDFSPALYLERGARCGGEVIGCNAGGFASPAVVVARLAEDEVVTLIVDGTDGGGSVDLNVEDISGEVCPNQPGFDRFEPVSGVLTAGDPSVLTGSCVPAQQLVLPGGLYPLPEHSYPLTVDGATCRVAITADAPVAIYVQEGLACGGRELFCEAVDEPEEGVLIEGGSLGQIMGDALDYVVTVEATNPNGPDVNYTLEFFCAQP